MLCDQASIPTSYLKSAYRVTVIYDRDLLPAQCQFRKTGVGKLEGFRVVLTCPA